MRTRGLLSTMQRQDVLDRVILTVGFIIFSLAVLYVVSRRIGLLTLQRKLADAIRSGSLSAEDIVAKAQPGPAEANVPAPAPPIYDELWFTFDYGLIHCIQIPEATVKMYASEFGKVLQSTGGMN